MVTLPQHDLDARRGGVEQTIRIGVVGTGFGATIHAPVLKRLAGVTVVGVAGARPERTQTVARSLGVERAYESWQALLADDSLAAVTVAVPPVLQREVVLEAVRRGKHVLCEKPFGMSGAQAREMRDAARAAGVVHMIDYLFRAAPPWMSLQALLRAEAIGTIRRVNVEWTLAGRPTRNPEWGWHFDHDAGGGTLFAFGSHVIDYVEWLFGPIASVTACLSTRKPIHGGGPHVTLAEDTVDAVLLLRDGTPVAVSLSTATPGGRGQWIAAYGERGALVLGNGNLHDAVIGTTLARTGPAGDSYRPVPIETAELPGWASADGRAGLFAKTAAAFTDAIRSGTQARPDFGDGWRAQLAMDAIRASARTRRWTDVVESDE